MTDGALYKIELAFQVIQILSKLVALPIPLPRYFQVLGPLSLQLRTKKGSVISANKGSIIVCSVCVLVFQLQVYNTAKHLVWVVKTHNLKPVQKYYDTKYMFITDRKWNQSAFPMSCIKNFETAFNDTTKLLCSC